MKKNYKCIFFDLDHTLWDYETNSSETLLELFNEFNIDSFIPSFDQFQKVFHKINDSLWTDYHKNRISHIDIRTRRFREVFHQFQANNHQLAQQLNDYYIERGPKKSKLFSGAIELLEYLQEKYKLLILSNGFTLTQETKLRESRIRHFFHWVITSESSGYTKPAVQIFEHAMYLSNTSPSEVIMIGDNMETDIKGAINADIDYIHFNPHHSNGGKSGQYKVNKLIQIRDLL